MLIYRPRTLGNSISQKKKRVFFFDILRDNISTVRYVVPLSGHSDWSEVDLQVISEQVQFCLYSLIESHFHGPAFHRNECWKSCCSVS